MALLLAIVLPALFWGENVNTAAELRNAGITQIAVPRPEAAHWNAIAGISAHPVDITATVKLPAPGVALRIDEASASRVPWISSNGWRFMRHPAAQFYYDAPPNTAALAAAEAFCYGSEALIGTDSSGIEPLGKMFEFLRSINSDEAKALADIGFSDDGSAVSAEVMNLMIRNNLLFEILRPSASEHKLIVRPASKEYPATSVKDADSVVRKVRADLTDAKRTVRLFGASVVIVRLTGEPDRPRVHLLNYGAPAHIRVGGFRVRVLGRYSKSQIHSFDSRGEQLLDYEMQSDATEFTVPELKTYAVVDLAR
jgi:hypothetical protein